MKAIATAAICMILLLTGCSHNSSLLALGEHNQFGFGPPETSAGWRSANGLFFLDVGRENRSFRLKMDADKGVKFDESTGTLTGVTEIEMKTGPQITGYLVKLAKANPELAKLYLDYMMKQEEETITVDTDPVK